MENKPNFYAIIPANVRYDKDLSPNAKLLYGEITSLCNEKGYCWANNNYFMELYALSERSIQILLKQLSEKEYIKIVIEKNKYRKIFITDNPEKNFGVPRKIFRPNPEKNFPHNNKMNKKNKYNENIPNWVDKEIKEDYLSDEELLELESKLTINS